MKDDELKVVSFEELEDMEEVVCGEGNGKKFCC